MATIDTDPQYGLQDVRLGKGSTVGSLAAGTKVNYLDQAGLDAALTAANGTYYTQARLDKMLKNDKVYAYRLLVDAAGVK